MDDFDESDSEYVIDDLPAQMKSLNFSEKSKFVYLFFYFYFKD